MSTLLAVYASPRGDFSVSRTLTHTFVEAWRQNHADSTVVTRDLTTTPLPFVDLPWIAGAFSSPDRQTDAHKAALGVSDDLIAELKAADHIVLGTPMYNFNIPANVKAWIDHIVRYGVTFSASYEGLLKGKKVTVIVASGSVYTPGSHMELFDLETGYLKHIFGFIGLTDVTFIKAGGSNDVNQGKVSLEAFVKGFEPAILQAAR